MSDPSAMLENRSYEQYSLAVPDSLAALEHLATREAQLVMPELPNFDTTRALADVAIQPQLGDEKDNGHGGGQGTESGLAELYPYPRYTIDAKGEGNEGSGSGGDQGSGSGNGKSGTGSTGDKEQLPERDKGGSMGNGQGSDDKK